MADYKAEYDDLTVDRLKQAGAVILGKTNMPEFGHKGTTDNLLFGPTSNPWNLDCIAGGSSGGSAAAVAAGMAYLALGQPDKTRSGSYHDGPSISAGAVPCN